MKYIPKEKRKMSVTAYIFLIALIIGLIALFVKIALHNRNEATRQEINHYEAMTAQVDAQNKSLEFELMWKQAQLSEEKQSLNDEYARFEALKSATYRLETGNGESDLWVSSNNAGGVKCGDEYCAYNDKTEGMAALSTLLRDYINSGHDMWTEEGLINLRNRYCGNCGQEDINTFLEIFYEELNHE